MDLHVSSREKQHCSKHTGRSSLSRKDLQSKTAVGMLPWERSGLLFYLHPPAELPLPPHLLVKVGPAHQKGWHYKAGAPRTIMVLETPLSILSCPAAHCNPHAQSASCCWLYPGQTRASSSCPLPFTASVTLFTPLSPPLYGSYGIKR